MTNKVCFYFILVFISISCFELNAQITFNEAPKVTALMDRYYSESTSASSIDGWRIKLISTTDRRKFENIKYRFESEFSSRDLITSYENPYYSLKVGAFADRFDLEPDLLRLKQMFPEAIPFRDQIEKAELFKRD